MELETEVAGLRLSSPVMNAAGICKTPEDVRDMAGMKGGAIVVGSITVLDRAGNEGRVRYFTQTLGLNSVGLKNGGRDFYERHLPEMVSIAHDSDKALILSVAGFSPEEYADLAETGFERGVDAVELNLGCPNVWGPGGQKPIASFDSSLRIEILRQVQNRVGAGARVTVKLSPFSDPLALAGAANDIAGFPMVRAVVSCNTFPNAFAYGPNEEPAITPGGGLGGLSGPPMKPLALGQVIQLRNALPPHIDIIGVGGITDGEDALEFLRCRAKAVQIGTACLHGGTYVLNQVTDHLARRN